MNDISKLADTIAPKSDQLNADDLITGPITVTITNVSRGSKDQPVSIAINDRMPFKPCKTMRRVLIKAWGDDGKKWIGRSMTLYCDPSVKFGGVAVGGIRISHLSHIDKPLDLMLTTSRARKSQTVIQPLVLEDYSAIIEKYKSTPDGEEKEKLWATLNQQQQAAILEEFNNG